MIPMLLLPPSREVGRFTAVAGAYFLISLLGVAFVVQPEHLSVFWPGTHVGRWTAASRRNRPIPTARHAASEAARCGEVACCLS